MKVRGLLRRGVTEDEETQPLCAFDGDEELVPCEPVPVKGCVSTEEETAFKCDIPADREHNNKKNFFELIEEDQDGDCERTPPAEKPPNGEREEDNRCTLWCEHVSDQAKSHFSSRCPVIVKVWKRVRDNSLLRRAIAEAIGTCLMVAMGTGVVSIQVLTQGTTHSGLFQIAAVWGIAVCLAIVVTGPSSGAHLNPAMSIAFALFRGRGKNCGEFPTDSCNEIPFRWTHELPVYISAQMMGGMIAGLTNLLLFWTLRSSFNDASSASDNETALAIASCYGEYFPNPGLVYANDGANVVSIQLAFFVEFWATLILSMVAFAVSARDDLRNLAPLLIGGCVTMLISVFAPFTQLGMNPARDFGPRLMAAIAGVPFALDGSGTGFWVYLVAPIGGAICGGFLYEKVLRSSEEVVHLESNLRPCGTTRSR